MINERLQKVLSQAGLGSRREMEHKIQNNEVKVNGVVATIGMKVCATDKIHVDGKLVSNPLAKSQTTRILLYHKPIGEICSRTDPKHTKTVFDNLPMIRQGRWIQVGRLDINTSGLLIFTNNGEFANRLMHPKFEIEREYAVRVLGNVTPEALKNMKKGVMLDDKMAAFNDIIYKGGEGQNSWYHVVLKEGRNREVRRIWETQSLIVSRLIRVRFGAIELPRYLSRGQYQELTPSEIDRFKRMLPLTK